jgi:uncharacterized protein (TIGR01777 family)
MRIAIAGSTGLIGSALVTALEARGDEVVRLVRPQTDADGIAWDPAAGTIDATALEGFDVVVNLAGRSIGERRWTEREKRLLWDSRVDSTGLLATTLAELEQPPALFVNASAVGIYGDRGDDVVTAGDEPGAGFLADLTVAWEEATEPAAAAGVGVALLRTGIVLSTEGGAIGRLLAPLGPTWFSPYRWGLGGVVGRGNQWWSWISLDDEIRAILHVIDEKLTGPIDLVSPEPATHRRFIKTLGRALGRPTVLPIPPFVVKILLGSELARALVLEGQRVAPKALVDGGFGFSTTDLEAGLREVLQD